MVEDISGKGSLPTRATVEYDYAAISRRDSFINQFVHVDPDTIAAISKNVEASANRIAQTAKTILHDPHYQALEKNMHQSGEDFGIVTAMLDQKYKDAPEQTNAVPLGSPEEKRRLAIAGRVIDVTPEEKQAYSAMRIKTDRAADDHWSYISKSTRSLGLPQGAVVAVGRALNQSHYEEVMEEAAIQQERPDAPPRGMVREPHEKKRPPRT